MPEKSHCRPRPIAAGVYFGLALSGVLAFYALLSYWVLGPLHAQEVWQPLLGALLSLERLLQTPALAVQRFAERPPHHLATVSWGLTLLLNIVIYFLAGFVGAVLWRWLRQPHGSGQQQAAAPAESPSAPAC